MNFLPDLLYHREHMWLRREGSDEAVLGVTEFAQEQLGQISFIEHLDPGELITLNGAFGTIESAKTASDLIAPASGTILCRNERLNEEPWLVNEDPYGEGWILRIRLADPAELDVLLSPEQYGNAL
ncbi:MAG: glycine cleavage system protein GcvH [Pseudomonadota bacterium]